MGVRVSQQDKPAATSTKAAGTVSRRTITALAAHYKAVPVADSPVIVAGTAPPDCGDLPLAMAALIHAAGDRMDVLLRTSGHPDGEHNVLVIAAQRLNWMRPEILPPGDDGTALVDPRAHRGVVLLHAHRDDPQTLTRAAAMVRASIPTACWCGECGPHPLTAPCAEHSLRKVRAAWQAQTWGTRPAA
jgi:hypothetical protein